MANGDQNGHTPGPIQGGAGAQSTRLWAHLPGGDVIVANFDVSTSLRHETKVANARRARLCWNFCDGLSNEDIERLMALGYKAGHWTRGL